MNCPFYGRHLVPCQDEPPFLLIDQRGNQCALCTTSHSPCYVDTDGQAVDWRACRRIEAISTAVDRDIRALAAGTH